MKKLLLVLASLAMIIGLCACGGGGGLFAKPTPTPIPEIDPATLITTDDVALNAGYTPVIEESGTSRNGNVATVLYRSEPIGQNDTVTVKVTQFTDTIDYQMLFDQYEQEKSKRSSAELVEGIGQESYIAFPTIHVYDRGCIIEITAGSGSDDNQKTLLKNLAITAASRLESIIPDNTGQNKRIKRKDITLEWYPFCFDNLLKELHKRVDFFATHDIIKKFDIWGVLCYNYVVKIVVNEKGGK